MNRLFLNAFLGLSLLVGCGEPTHVMNGEFETLSKFLDRIKIISGATLKIFVDEPDMVSGTLTNGESFACQKRTSGTKGTFYHGWYTTRD